MSSPIRNRLVDHGTAAGIDRSAITARITASRYSSWITGMNSGNSTSGRRTLCPTVSTSPTPTMNMAIDMRRQCRRAPASGARLIASAANADATNISGGPAARCIRTCHRQLPTPVS
jgi:hypothetical protein